ncbi:hypothetical protein EV356DRAFT_4955 [Viridothelium virens]|uniref:Uncharacterized protein n=1 Tax=Viridothelium virens TaxID=1048519 RepID=A0A6A6HPB6_VIRVR|nr:hypothetical protein EV356DRAFT_4955 [Viridothelium virens]
MSDDKMGPAQGSPTGAPRLALDEDIFKRLHHARQGHLAFQYMTTGHVPYEVFENPWPLKDSVATPVNAPSGSLPQPAINAPVQRDQEQGESTEEGHDQNAADTQDRKVTRPNVLYGQTMKKRTGKPHGVRVKVDSGSDVNLISYHLVKECGFRSSRVSEFIIGIGGHRTELKKLVKIPLAGQSKKTEHVDFYEAPEESPFDDLLVGRPFEETFGDPYAFFWDRPLEKDSLVAVQERLKVCLNLSWNVNAVGVEKIANLVHQEEERDEIENNRAQHQTKVLELERKRNQQAQQRGSSGQQVRGGRTSSASASSTGNSRRQT